MSSTNTFRVWIHMLISSGSPPSHMAAPKTCESASARGLKYWPISELRKEGLRNICCCSVTQLCPTLGDPMDCSTPGLPVSETEYDRNGSEPILTCFHTTEDETVGCHHRLNGHGFGWTPGVRDGRGDLACCGSWGRKESDMTEQLNWMELIPLPNVAVSWVIHACLKILNSSYILF